MINQLKIKTFKKIFKKNIKNSDNILFYNSVFSYGVISITFGILKNTHLETLRKQIIKSLNLFSYMRSVFNMKDFFTQKAIGTRMGTCVGKFKFFGLYVCPGKLLFEINSSIFIFHKLKKNILVLNKHFLIKVDVIKFVKSCMFLNKFSIEGNLIKS
jgi:ribosomal protein L16/L10AE